VAFKKILIVIFPIFLLAPTSAIADAESVRCSTFLDLEREINKTLPRKIDEVAELIQLSVTCETSTIKYTKRFLFDKSLLAQGYKSTKQRHHNYLHCGTKGLAFKDGWTATDVWLDKDFGYLATFITSPPDCN
jgi:hypothetical protein|tara:strand:+ start:73 stop:471 length:399 start_codon:yes stop_codon:yes gene_type:complete